MQSLSGRLSKSMASQQSCRQKMTTQASAGRSYGVAVSYQRVLNRQLECISVRISRFLPRWGRSGRGLIGEGTSPRYSTTPRLRSRRLELHDRGDCSLLEFEFFRGGVTTAGFARGGSVKYGTTFGHDLQRNTLTPGSGPHFDLVLYLLVRFVSFLCGRPKIKLK